MTMMEVARRAGTSQATVSRVVNDNPYVSDETRSAVLKAMKELGYNPRARARSASSPYAPSRSRAGHGALALIGVDRSHEKHPALAAEKWRGVMEAAAETGLDLCALPAYEGVPLPASFRPDEWDGVILWGRQVSDDLLAALGDKPRVWISSHGNPGEEQILSINEVVGRLAARYLLERGHQSIGFLSLSTTHPGLAMRGDGFRYAAKCESHAPVLLVDAESDQVFDEMSDNEISQAMKRLTRRLVELKPRPTGWFIPDDQMTAMIYPVLQEAGIRLGEDLEFISCNNEVPYITGLKPRPATIDLAPYLTGRQAVHQLLWNKNHPDAARQTSMMTSPRLIPGDLNRWDVPQSIPR